ncbi:MAG: hypothetical protein MJE77_13935 [Proteobacteria bacterium]|nr:hypothetical protein [Pseudomonadota bacterium]
MTGQLSCKSAEHYTPAEYVEAGRYVLGEIDLDPASSFAANLVVRAKRWYGLIDAYGRSYRPEDGLVLPWGGRVFVKPPDDRTGRLVRQFWRRANEHVLLGGPGAAVLWVGFSLEQLGTLQFDCGDIAGMPCPAPQEWPHVTVPKRIHWEARRFDYATGSWVSVPGRQPSHGNYFCLLGDDRAQRARFRERFGQFGRYSAPLSTPSPRRDLAGEILAALRDSSPLTKSALARRIRARKATVLRLIDQLANSGRVHIDAEQCSLVETRPQRVASRAECQAGPRPCPWVGCRHHLLLDVKEGGSLVLWQPGRRPGRPRELPAEPSVSADEVEAWAERAADTLESMPDTCSLDVADRGEHDAEDVATILAVSVSRVHQLESRAVAALRALCGRS